MKQLVVALFLFVSASPAVADDAGVAPPSDAGVPPPDPHFYGHWAYKGEGGELHLNPKAACKDWEAARKKSGMKYELKGTKKSTRAGNINDYSCLYIDKNDPKKPTQDMVDGVIQGIYQCPANSTAVSLNNSGKFEDHRCRCADGQTCYSQSPPAPENSPRCTQEAAPKKRTKAEADAESAKNKAKAAKADKQFTKDYKATADEYANETCAFKPADFYPDAPSDLNIGFLCGKLESDFAAANNLAGLPKTPDGWVWHHHEEMGRMQLVSKAAHKKCPHTGGVKIWSETIGMKDYPNSLPQRALKVPLKKLPLKKPLKAIPLKKK